MNITDEMKNNTGIEGDMQLNKENLLKAIKGATDEKYKYVGIVFNTKGIEQLCIFTPDYTPLYDRIFTNFDEELIGFNKGIESGTSIKKFWVADNADRICEMLEM